MSKTSRSTARTLQRTNAPKFLGLLRLVVNDTAALRGFQKGSMGISISHDSAAGRRRLAQALEQRHGAAEAEAEGIVQQFSF